jgi:hypothetical protein
MDSLVNDAKSAWKREGLLYVIKNAPGHLIRKYGPNYSLFEYFALGREDLVSHCKKQGQIWYYDSGIQFEMSPPLNKEVPTEYEDLIGTRSIGPNFVCEVSNAKLVGPYAIPVSPNGKIIKETFGTSGMFQSRLRRTFQELGKTKSLKLLLDTPTTDQNSTHYDTVAHLVVRHGPNYDNPNYGHWINENLPQLQAIEHYEESTGENVKLLINRDPPSWLRDILEYMGYSSDDWIVWNKQSAIVDKLIIPKLSYVHSFDVDPNPLGKKWARQRALKKEDSNHSHGFSERIFMSRQGGGRRKIKNFQEVENKLDEFGFEIYRPENLSTKEEVDLFSQANIIVGVTGSNLAGIMFSTDARVMEIFPHNEYLHVYYTLSNELGFEYMYLTGSGEREDSDDGSIHRNIVVDIDELEEHLIELLDK